MELSAPEEYLGEILRGYALSIWTALPCRVVAYDKTTQRVQVQPVPEDVDGELPVLAGVPVMFPRGSGAAMVWPIKKGDTGLLVFCSRSIARWLAEGAEGDPLTEQHHHIGDAVFMAGLDWRALADVQDNVLELREPDGGEIQVGKGASLAAARKTDEVSPTLAMSAWFSAVSASLVALGRPAIPAPASFGTITGGSATVKVK